MEKNIKLSTDTDVLLDAFQLEKVYGSTLIDDWMNAKGELTVEDNAILEKIYQHSFKKVGGWNESDRRSGRS